MLIANYLLWLLLPVCALTARRLRERQFYLLLATLVAALVCVTQDISINKDREQYLYLINAIANEGLALMEPGYLLLVRLLSSVTSGMVFEALFFLVVALLSVGVKMALFARYGGSLFGCLMAYFSYFFLLHEMTQIRVGLAIGLLYFSWFSWLEDRRRAYYIFGLLATLFHASCLIFLIAPWMLTIHRKDRWHSVLILLTSLCLASLLAGQWFIGLIGLLERLTSLEKLTLYLQLFDDGAFSEISPVRLIPHLLLLSLYWLHRKRWRKQPSTLMLVRIYVVGILTFLALSPMPVFAYRMSDLFLFSGILLIGRLRSLLHPTLYYPFVIVYTAVFVFYTTLLSGLFAPIA